MVDLTVVLNLAFDRFFLFTKISCISMVSYQPGAKIWNSLPVDLRLLSQSLRTFGHKLKHYLFVDEP